MTISDKEFKTEFNSNQNNWLELLVGAVKCDWIENVNMFQMLGKVAKHVEETSVKFGSQRAVKIEDIPDDVIINLLDGIENRL